MDRLKYYHYLPNGQVIYGGHIQVSTAEQWEIKEGTLYHSSGRGTFVLATAERVSFLPPDEARELLMRDGLIPEPAEPQTVRFTLRLPPSLKERLDAAATASSDSVNKTIIEALEALYPPDP